MKFITLIFCCLFSLYSLAAEPNYTIVLKNHRFNPAKTIIPAGKKVKLLVINQDTSIDEFHSDDLGVEKIIAGNSKAFIFVGPLKPGVYSFMGEFNAKTAQGTIVAK